MRLYSIIVLIAIYPMAFFSACDTKDIGVTSTRTIIASAAGIHDDLSVVKKHVDGIGAPYAEDADKKAGAIISDGAKVEANLDALQTRAETAENNLKKERTHWVGYPIRMLSWWTLIGLLVAAIIVGILCVATPLGAILGPLVLTLLKWIYHICTLGIVAIVARIQAWLTVRKLTAQRVDEIHQATVPATLPSGAPAAT